MSDTARPEGNLQELRRQIDDAKREYDALDMKPQNFESPHDALVGKAVSQLLKTLFFLVGVMGPQHG